MLFGGKSCTAPGGNISGKLTHGLFRDHEPIPSRERSLRKTHIRNNLRPPALAFFPHRKRLQRGIFGPLQPAAGNRGPDKSLLVRRRIDVHAFTLRVSKFLVNVKQSLDDLTPSPYRSASLLSLSPNRSSCTPILSISDKYRLHARRLSSPLSR